MQTLIVVLVAGLGVYAAVVALFYVAQRGILFPAPAVYASPDATGVPMREVPLRRDDATIMTWRTERTPGRPLVLAFHGNGDSLPRIASGALFWQSRGYDVVLSTYRGYPGSTGRPSEAALVADAVALFDAIVEEGTPPGDIVLAGFSLGTAMAAAVGAERRPRALFLQAPPSAIVEVARHHYPWLPVGPLMRDRFPTSERIARVEAPVFIVHGDEDPVVPLRFGRRLLEAAREPKRLLVIPGAGHILAPDMGWAEFESFLAETLSSPAAAQ